MTHKTWYQMRLPPDVNDLWNCFCSWAEHNGIGTHEDDWRPWWNCYRAGADGGTSVGYVIEASYGRVHDGDRPSEKEEAPGKATEVWRIRSTVDPDLLWSNEQGWVSGEEEATVFFGQERHDFSLPMEGKWEVIEL